MRGGLIQKILRNLTAQEIQELKRLLSTHAEKAHLLQLLQVLLDCTYSEEFVVKHLKVSKRAKNTLVDEFGKILVRFFGQNSPEFRLENHIEIAKRLAMARENECVQMVLRPVIDSANDSENYDILVKALNLLNVANISPEPKSPILAQVVELQMVNAMLSNILQNVWKARAIESIVEKKSELEKLRHESLLLYGEYKVGQKGQLTFLRIQAVIDSILRDRPTWYESQEALVAQVEAYPQFTLDPEYELAKEVRLLAQMYWQAGNYVKFKELSLKFEQLNLSHRKAQFERITMQFPFFIGVAIETGNRKLGEEFVSKFFDLASNGYVDGQGEFVTWNLYWCAYFQIANMDFESAWKTVLTLKREPKSTFKPNHLYMANLLEIVLSIEFGDFEDATRLIKNLSRSAKASKLPGLEAGISILRQVLKFIENSENLNSTIDLIDWNCIHGKEFSSYFDLKLWYAAKISNSPMLEMFKHRTLENPLENFTLNRV